MQRDELTKTLNELASQLDSDAPHMLYWQSTRAVARRPARVPQGRQGQPDGIFRAVRTWTGQDHPYKLISVEDTRFLHTQHQNAQPYTPNCAGDAAGC